MLAAKFDGNINITVENTRITRYFSKRQRDAKKVDVAVQKQLKCMLEDLLDELKDVFDAEDIKWIESCRNVSSLSMNRGVQLVWILPRQLIFLTGIQDKFHL